MSDFLKNVSRSFNSASAGGTFETEEERRKREEEEERKRRELEIKKTALNNYKNQYGNE